MTAIKLLAIIKVLFLLHCQAATLTPSLNSSSSSSSNSTFASTAKPEETVKNAKAMEMSLTTRNADINLFAICPRMLAHVFENAIPQKNVDAGVFKEYAPPDMPENGEVDLSICIAACCAANNKQSRKPRSAINNSTTGNCNVVFVYKQKCYHVHCFTNDGCLPKERAVIKQRLQMVLVQPLVERDSDEQLTWLQLLRADKQKNKEEQLANLNELLNGVSRNSKNDAIRFDEAATDANRDLSFWKPARKFHFANRHQDSTLSYDDEDFPLAEKRVKQILMAPLDETTDELGLYRPNLAAQSNVLHSCDMELSQLTGRRCGLHEECVMSVCRCGHGYVRNELHECVLSTDIDYQQLMDAAASEMVSAAVNDDETPQQSAQQPDEWAMEKHSDVTMTTMVTLGKLANEKQIQVTVASKTVRLPEQQVTLTAHTQPEEVEAGEKFKYLWTLVTQPKGPINGTITDQSESTVRLSNLSEGLYTFKVSVTGTDGMTGEAEANVTVLPVKRLNRPPVAVISPKEQTIRQPTTNAILDGSPSSDDDKIISWHWEVVQAPLGYQPHLPEVSTLQLTDLTLPGNYNFKLTVMDSNNVTNSTMANITVLKGTDYPPVANAGDAVILYLPNNNVTLNGTASSDDHDIIAWEWTKDASDEAKAVDMQKTRTPFLQLSNLEEGMYTFVLKVTDGSNQSSTAKVHVFVKPPSNSPPKAVAGINTTITLPQNWVILNGSESRDDIKIVRYQWQMAIGPKPAVILMANSSVANGTALTLGLYKFLLSVTDENNNTATDSIWVKVVQEKNAPPVANAGGNLNVTLPITALYLNGSKSSDDLAVAKYQWSRDGSSLAAGMVVGYSDEQPVLILTNLVHGRYVFQLTVSDDQGLTSSDTVIVHVRSDPLLMNLVELTLPLSAFDLTKSELDTILQKIGLLLGDMKICMRELKYDSKSQATIVVFYAEEPDEHGNLAAVDGLYVEQMLKVKLLRDAKILGTVFADVRTTICQNKCSDHGTCDAVTRSCMCEAFWMPSAAYLWGLEEANCDWSILYVFVGLVLFFILISAIFWGLSLTCQKKRKIGTKKLRTRSKVQKYSLIGAHDEETPNHGRSISLTDSETDSDVLFETRTKPNSILRNNGATKRHNHSGGKYSHTKLSRKIKA